MRRLLALLCILLLAATPICLATQRLALVIGISEYQNHPDLVTPANDARELATLLHQHYGYRVCLLLDHEASRKNILATFLQLCQLTANHQVSQVVIFYAGHGSSNQIGESFWIPADAGGKEDYISHTRIQKFIEIISCQELLIVADSCFSGQLLTRAVPAGGRYGQSKLAPIAKSPLPTKMVISSGGNEPVLDQTPGEQQHSVFANKFLQLLAENRAMKTLRDHNSPFFRQLATYVQQNAQQQPQLGFLYGVGSDQGSFHFRRQSKATILPVTAVLGKWQSNYGPVTIALNHGKGEGQFLGQNFRWKLDGLTIHYQRLAKNKIVSGNWQVVNRNLLRGGDTQNADWLLWRNQENIYLPKITLRSSLVKGNNVYVAPNQKTLKLVGYLPRQQLQKLSCYHGNEPQPIVIRYPQSHPNYALFQVRIRLHQQQPIHFQAKYPRGLRHLLLQPILLGRLQILPDPVTLSSEQQQQFTAQVSDYRGKLLTDLKILWQPPQRISATGVWQPGAKPGEYSIAAQVAGTELRKRATITVTPSPAQIQAEKERQAQVERERKKRQEQQREKERQQQELQRQKREQEQQRQREEQQRQREQEREKQRKLKEIKRLEQKTLHYWQDDPLLSLDLEKEYQQRLQVELRLKNHPDFPRYQDFLQQGKELREKWEKVWEEKLQLQEKLIEQQASYQELSSLEQRWQRFWHSSRVLRQKIALVHEAYQIWQQEVITALEKWQQQQARQAELARQRAHWSKKQQQLLVQLQKIWQDHEEDWFAKINLLLETSPLVPSTSEEIQEQVNQLQQQYQHWHIHLQTCKNNPPSSSTYQTLQALKQEALTLRQRLKTTWQEVTAQIEARHQQEKQAERARYFLPALLWQKSSFPVGQTRVLDFTSHYWQKLSRREKRIYTRLYQEGYARVHNLSWQHHFSLGLSQIAMVLIPPGRYYFGPPQQRQKVTIAQGFWLSQYEITQSQWHAVTGRQPWQGQNYVMEGAQVPASYISWQNIKRDFLSKVSSAYRLPSEAEWEYAYRAGTLSSYYWGQNSQAIGNYAWYDANSDQFGLTCPNRVGQKKPNFWDLYDMSGNVYEWCANGSPTKKVARGGYWFDPPGNCTATFRYLSAPGNRSSALGFRLLRRLEEPK